MGITQRLKSSRVLVAAVFVILGLLYCINFEDRSFWVENEAFYALGSRSVLEGNVLLPRIYNNEYANKPPLFFWWAAAISAPLGGVSEWSVRLANILAAIGILAGLFLFASKWINRWVGLLAVLLTGTSAEFWQQATQVSTDLLMVALLVFAWSALFGILTDRFTWGRWAVLWGCLGLGLLTKGPVVLILSGPIALLFCLWRQGWREGWKRPLRTRPFLGAITSASFFALWCAAVYWVYGSEPLHTVVIKHNFTRFLNAFDHLKPWWYYFHKLPAILLPWSLLLPWAAWHWYRSLRRDWNTNLEAIAFALIIGAVVFLFFSASSSKRDYYLLPLVPWLSLALAASLWSLFRKSEFESVESENEAVSIIIPQWWRWKLGRVVAIAVLGMMGGYALYSGIVSEFLEERKSPKPLASIINHAVDENDRLVLIEEDDPRILYYLNEKYEIVDIHDPAALKKLQVALAGEEEMVLVVEERFMDQFDAGSARLYLEQTSAFKGKRYFILTNERLSPPESM